MPPLSGPTVVRLSRLPDRASLAYTKLTAAVIYSIVFEVVSRKTLDLDLSRTEVFCPM